MLVSAKGNEWGQFEERITMVAASACFAIVGALGVEILLLKARQEVGKQVR